MTGERGRFDTQADGRRWLSIRNDSGEEIPPFAVLRLTGLESRSGQTVFVVSKPDATTVADSLMGDRSKILVNGPQRILDGKYGAGTQEYPAQVKYTTLGPLMGPAADDWGLSNLSRGFVDLNLAQSSVGGGMPTGTLARWVSPGGVSLPVACMWDASGTLDADGGLFGDATGGFDPSGAGQDLAAGVITSAAGGYIVNAAGYYRVTFSATLWTEVASSEGAVLTLSFAVVTGGVTAPVGSSLRVQLIDDDGSDQGYGVDPVISQEMVSMEAIVYAEADDHVRIVNYSTLALTPIAVYITAASFGIEMLRYGS